jgi:hypothetical protein
MADLDGRARRVVAWVAENPRPARTSAVHHGRHGQRRDPRLRAPALQGALPAHQAAPGPPTRRQGRANRARSQADHGWCRDSK